MLGLFIYIAPVKYWHFVKSFAPYNPKFYCIFFLKTAAATPSILSHCNPEATPLCNVL